MVYHDYKWQLLNYDMNYIHAYIDPTTANKAAIPDRVKRAQEELILLL